MIKPSDNGGLEIVADSAKNKVLISDTTLRSFIQPQVCKTTPRLHQICGYEICIIHKDIQIDWNRLRTKLLTYLQHKSVGIHTWKSVYSNTIASH